MALYLAQHGKCYPEEADPDRKLTEEGMSESGKTGSMLKKRNIHVGRIVHSGKTRARETAEIFSVHLKPERGVAGMEGMNPNDSVEEFAAKLSFDDTLYVGHLPFMGKLTSLLVTGDTASEAVKFRNSCVVCLERDASSGRVSVSWVIHPDSE